VWHDSPYDEHPSADITLGHNQIWADVSAIADAGHWDDTVFLLTWDDGGGYDDHVATPNVEHTPTASNWPMGPGYRC
jgi:phospholipase C